RGTEHPVFCDCFPGTSIRQSDRFIFFQVLQTSFIHADRAGDSGWNFGADRVPADARKGKSSRCEFAPQSRLTVVWNRSFYYNRSGAAVSLTQEQALELFRSDDLIGIGMEADAARRKLHPEGVVTYIIDRNINYTNFCTEYCTFCAFYAPVNGPGRSKGYVLDFETIYEKLRETVELGGTGVLMQGGLHPELKLEWYEEMLRGIKQRF